MMLASMTARQASDLFFYIRHKAYREHRAKVAQSEARLEALFDTYDAKHGEA